MKLLFIGNSHTYYNDMPLTVKQLLEATGERAHVTMLTKGGNGLDYHAQDPATAFNIRHGEYDLVIAQDRAAQFDPIAFLKGAKALKELADEAGTQLLLYMPWAKSDSRHLQREMTEAYLDFCKGNGLRLAPAGETFTKLLQTEDAATLYREDGNHATPVGSYAAALTVFYTVTERKRVLNPEAINDPGIAMGLPPALCRKLHTEACHTARLYNG